MAPITQTELGRSNSIVDQRKFGRRYAPDPRDRFHPMAAHLDTLSRAELKVRTQSPMHGPTLDQGNTPKCVKYSAATSVSAAPVNFTQSPLLSIVRVEREVDGIPDLYEWAQKNDEWPGEDYEGTSVRAGQEYLKKVDLSSGYVWARTLAEAKDYIKRVGSAPIILGVDWLDKMSEPELIKGNYYISAEGPVVGGHAICCLWFDKVKKAWKLQNSWGEEWGDKGIVYLPDDMFEYLVFQANGEAVSFVENKAA